MGRASRLKAARRRAARSGGAQGVAEARREAGLRDVARCIRRLSRYGRQQCLAAAVGVAASAEAGAALHGRPWDEGSGPSALVSRVCFSRQPAPADEAALLAQLEAGLAAHLQAGGEAADPLYQVQLAARHAVRALAAPDAERAGEEAALGAEAAIRGMGGGPDAAESVRSVVLECLESWSASLLAGAATSDLTSDLSSDPEW